MDLTLWQEVFLVVTAFFTSTLSGVLGMGGGMLLFAVMANMMPPTTVIPLHGLIQLGSNLSRSVFGRSFLEWRIVGPFLIGGAIGAVLGSFVVVEISPMTFTWVLGLFILVVTWAPLPKEFRSFPGKFFWVGGGSTFMSLFVGATGPFVAPFYLHENLNRKQLVATKAACQSGTHALKVVVYFWAGFGLAGLWPLLGAMVAAVVLGSWVGTLLLGRVPEKLFQVSFRILITLLALRMLAKVTGWEVL